MKRDRIFIVGLLIVAGFLLASIPVGMSVEMNSALQAKGGKPGGGGGGGSSGWSKVK